MPALLGALAKKVLDGFVTGVDLKFGVNVLQMCSNSVEADVQVIRDFLVKAPFGKLRQDLHLALGELLHFYRRLALFVEEEDDLAGNLRGHR